MATSREERSNWTFLTNHAHVLVCLTEDSELRGKEIAEMVGITERATQKIISDLVNEDFLKKTKVGRRNRYEVKTSRRLRHPLEKHQTVKDLLDAVSGPSK